MHDGGDAVGERQPADGVARRLRVLRVVGARQQHLEDDEDGCATNDDRRQRGTHGHAAAPEATENEAEQMLDATGEDADAREDEREEHELEADLCVVLVWRAGAVLVPLDEEVRTRDERDRLRDSEAAGEPFFGVAEHRQEVHGRNVARILGTRCQTTSRAWELASRRSFPRAGSVSGTASTERFPRSRR